MLINEIWKKIKKTLNTKFHSKPVYDEKYLKTKVKGFITLESIYYTCIAAINIDSIIKIDKKTIPKFI